MATKITIDGYDSYSGADIVVTAQLSHINNTDELSKKCYVLGSLQTISISTYQNKEPVRSIGNINAIDYVMGPRTIAGSLVFAVFDRHFAYNIFNDLKKYSGKRVLLTDEIPPLDMTINFANEYGKKSRMVLYGVKMMTEGQVMSVNDMFTENTYQFVAVGMENLTPEGSSATNTNFGQVKDPVITNNADTPLDIPDTSGNGNKYKPKTNTDQIEEPNEPENEVKIIKINQPIVENGNGSLVVGINDPNAVEMVLLNKYKKDDNTINLTPDMFNGLNQWTVDLQSGTYDLKAYDKNTGKILKSFTDIVIPKYENTEKIKDYPIINYVTNNAAEIESNNPYHNKLNITQGDDDIIKNIQLDKDGKATIYSLLPNTPYSAYTEDNDGNVSMVSEFVTLTEPNELEDTFKDYVFANKNLWINDLSTFDYTILNDSENVNDLIDIICNSKYEHLDELMLYAVKYQNDFTKCINSQNEINTIDSKDLLDYDFEVKNNYDELVHYYKDNSNSYYLSSDSIINNIPASGKCKNKTGYAYALDNNNLKSLKYEYYNFEQDSKNELLNYNYKEIDFNDYDYKNYKNNNLNMSEELLETIILKDNNYSELYSLDAPIFDYDKDKEILTVDVNYKEYLKDDEKYYLCIVNKNDMLQHIPMIKISFSTNDEKLILNKYKTHIMKNNYYLLYIQDKDFKTISDTSILSTYTNTKQLDDYNIDKIINVLNNAKKYIISKYPSQKNFIDTLSLTLLAEDINLKNILPKAQQELLNIGLDSLQYSSLDYIFIDLYTYLSYTYNNINAINIDSYYKNDKLHILGNNYKIVILDFYENELLPIKTILYSNINNVIDFSEKTSYYTLVYAIDINTNNKTGFFLKNNSQNTIYDYKLL